MKAIIIDDYGPPDRLYVGEAAEPVPPRGGIVVRVAAVAVNPADWKWRSGMFRDFAPFAFPHILGYDASGTVVAGDGLPAGSRVVVMLDPQVQGAYAEYVAVAADRFALLPDALDFERAAAIPTAGLTGVQLVEEALDVQAGERVLITGATGAVGRFATAAAGARGAVIVAAVRPGQHDAALALGAHEVIDLEGDGGNVAPVQKVADTVGGEQTAALCRRIARNAIIHSVSTTPIPADGLLRAPSFYAIHPDAVRMKKLALDVAESRIPVPIARVMPFEDAAEAHRLIEAGGIGGKIILRP